MFILLVILGPLRYFLSNSSLPEGVQIAITALAFVVCMVVPYLLGQLNFAIIISKKKFGVDVRDYGSGNGGTTNMLRTFGKKSAIITLLGDMGKAIVSCLLGYLLLGRLGAFIAGLFCILGHTFPIKYKFRGGKGVACVAAVILMTDLGNVWVVPFIFIILLILFAVIALGLKYVSLASVMCMLIYPLFLYEVEQLFIDAIKRPDGTVFVNKEVGLYVVLAFLMAAIIVFMHRENIKRLWQGKESKLDLSKKSKPAFEVAPDNSSEIVEEAADTTAKRGDKPNPNTSKRKQKRNKK
jgi:glycerol-3-phosphate acyltransferase PlsY